MGLAFNGRVAFKPLTELLHMMRRIAIGCFALLLAGMAAPARAELVIYAQDTTVNSGGYGYLNIYLAGEPTDLFDTYQVTLSITPISPAVGTVVFTRGCRAGSDQRRLGGAAL